MIQQPAIWVQNHYRQAIRKIMAEHRIEPLKGPGPIVSARASFREVVQHTHWYVDAGDSRPHYRYRRYYEMLNHVKTDGRREAHVDLGCGAGVFSWAFFDWARNQDLEPDKIDLYGWDYCPAMIDLAGLIRDKLVENIPDYPELYYSNDLSCFLNQLTENHQYNTDYTVTLGHVLVQAGSPENIGTFADVMAHVLGLMDDRSNCLLWAADARRRSCEFGENWEALLTALRAEGIFSRVGNVRISYINNSNDAKFAHLIQMR